MGIDIMRDVVPAGVVAGVNIMARQSTSTILGQPVQDAVVYGMAVGGYLAKYMNWGGRNSDMVGNIGLGAAPLAIEKLYDALKSGTSGRAMRRVSRYPAPANETNFQGVRLSSRARGSGILV